MLRKQHWWILGATALAGLLMLGLPERAAARLKQGVAALFLPLFGLSQSAGRAAESAGALTVPRSELMRENERLRQENQELRLRQQQAAEWWRENEALRRQLGWKAQAPWNMKLARVIGRDPANWWRALHIDAGLADGLRPNYPVVTPEGLVGRLHECAEHRSLVVVVGDPKCRVAALVPEAQDSGVILPGASASWRNPFVELTYLSRQTELKPGQRVITSGLGGIFPRGIPIGDIADWRLVDGLYVEARVRLAVNLSALEEVWVLMP